jgi:hypothetical protein
VCFPTFEFSFTSLILALRPEGAMSSFQMYVMDFIHKAQWLFMYIQLKKYVN